MHADNPKNAQRQDLDAALAAAEENERKYRELVNHANSAIIRMDTGFTIQFVNEYALNFFGFSAEDLLGASLLDVLVPERDLNGTDQHAVCRLAVRSPETHGSYDQQNRCRNGRWVWMHWSVRAIRDARGAVRELLCVGIDITKRKEAEFRAERYRLRTRRLTDQLLTAEEKERGVLASYLHDNIIQNLSLANMRMGQFVDEMKHADTDTLHTRLAAIRALLSAAIGECRSVMDRLAPALLEELGIGAALRYLAEQQCGSDSTTIGIDDRLGDQPLPPALASLLFRSVRELLMNALKYAGPCRIAIALWREDNTVYAQVEDNGAGFDTETLEDSHYDAQGGFGLFAIRERLEGLGGSLSITSSCGLGTLACIHIPLPE